LCAAATLARNIFTGGDFEANGGGIGAFATSSGIPVLTLNSVYVVENAGGTATPTGGGGIYAGHVTLVLNNTTLRDDVGYQICGNNIPCN
jgi:hypothetical protein